MQYKTKLAIANKEKKNWQYCDYYTEDLEHGLQRIILPPVYHMKHKITTYLNPVSLSHWEKFYEDLWTTMKKLE
jgi:hypothetical protein